MEMMRVLAQHMQGDIELDRVVDIACKEKDRRVAAYIMHKSIEDITAEKIEKHSMIVQEMYRTEYVPGLMSKYINIVVGKNDETVKHRVLHIVLYIVQKIDKLSDVEGLEERMIMMMKHREVYRMNRDTEAYRVIYDIAHTLYTKASKEGRVHIAYTMIEIETSIKTQGIVVVHRHSNVHTIYNVIAKEDIQQIQNNIAEQSIQNIMQCRDIIEGNIKIKFLICG